MKAITHPNNFMNRPVVPFPNAISRRQAINKLLDGLLITFSGIGIVVMLVVLLTMV